jgi:hypothetical protein
MRPTKSSFARAKCREKRMLQEVFQTMLLSPKALGSPWISILGSARAAWLSFCDHSVFQKDPTIEAAAGPIGNIINDTIQGK